MGKRMKPTDRREHIIAAATEVASRDGYHMMRRDNVATEAGVSMGLVTRYFGTMVQLRRAVMRRAIERECIGIIAQGLAYKDRHAAKAPADLRRRAAELLAAE